MARHPDFDATKVGERLQGQCMEGLSDVIEDMYPGMTEDDLLSGDYDEIDNITFQCEECGWWCEDSQRGVEDNKCSDCSPEDE